MYTKNEKIYPAYVSKHNSKRKKQVNLLMIPNGEWHYITVKKFPALLRGKMSDIMVMNIVWIVFTRLEQKANLNHT